MRQQFVATLLAILICGQQMDARQTHPILKQNRAELAWNELGDIIVEKTVSTVLPDGTRIRGEVLAVRPDALVMNVQKSSAGRVHPLGQAVISRVGLTELRVIRNKGPVKAAGGVLGAVGSLSAVSYASAATESALVALFGLLFVLPMAIVGGYYLGKLADRHTTVITIRPEGE